MKQKNVILMVVAIGCGLVAAFLTTQLNAKPKVELVEVVVAAKDLPVGTLLSKTEIPKLTKRKQVDKATLPAKFVADESELLEKRLSKEVRSDEMFNPEILSTRGVIILPDGKDMVSLPMNPVAAAAGFIGPGSKVDILATLKIKDRLNSFPLLVDMLVLAVDTHTTNDTKTGVFNNMSMVSFAVTQEQALLLSMAKSRGCQIELLLRHPSKPLDPKYDMKKVKDMLQDDAKGGIHVSAEDVRNDALTPPDSPPVKPDTPSAKVETVKVLRATADIAANTEITKDLIAQSFAEKEMPREMAESLQPYSDLTPFLGQVFKTNIVKDQYVFKGMIGPQVSKAPPPEEFSLPKPEPKAEAKPAPAKAIRDVAFHTVSGTKIYRYEEVAPGEWKLKRVMSVEEANKAPGAPAEAASPEAAPEKPNDKPMTEKQAPDKAERKVD